MLSRQYNMAKWDTGMIQFNLRNKISLKCDNQNNVYIVKPWELFTDI